MWGGVFDDESTISAIQGFKLKNNYEIRNLREILHNICANVKMLHGHFKQKLIFSHHNHCKKSEIANYIVTELEK